VQITIQFTLDRSIDAAAQDVAGGHRAGGAATAAEHAHAAHLPEGQPRGFTDSLSRLVVPTLPLSTVDDYAETMLAQRISMITGVAQVSVFGSQQYAVRVQVDPNKLAAYGIGIDEVESAVEQGNVDQPTGALLRPAPGIHRAGHGPAPEGGGLPAAHRRLSQWQSGAPAGVGRVIDSVQNDKVASWFNNTRAIVLAIQRQPGANTSPW